VSGVRVPAPPPTRPRARLRRVEPVLRRAMRGPCRLPAGSRILVAVSGGADSTALLVGLHRLAGELGLSLVAAHLHHGLRGAEADGDEKQVERLCRSLGVPLRAARWDTRRRMRRRGLSGQAGLRRLRREFLRDVMSRNGCSGVATGHHAEDQLETMLARLLRGTGLAGLGGMSARRGVWLKPLLGVSRQEIEADLRRAGIPWREDASNRDPRYLRSRLRHEAIPALLGAVKADDAGRARSALALRVADSLREVRRARRLVERLAAELLRRADCHGGRLELEPLAAAPAVVRAAALRLAWRRLGTGQGLTARHLASLMRLAAGPARAAEVSLPAGWSARRRRDQLRFDPASD
jgi:tRNA(Ile)-lysidine synthase